jgi:hypothetical protein
MTILAARRVLPRLDRPREGVEAAHERNWPARRAAAGQLSLDERSTETLVPVPDPT